MYGCALMIGVTDYLLSLFFSQFHPMRQLKAVPGIQ